MSVKEAPPLSMPLASVSRRFPSALALTTLLLPGFATAAPVAPLANFPQHRKHSSIAQPI
jgi:hypothetical protein